MCGRDRKEDKENWHAPSSGGEQMDAAVFVWLGLGSLNRPTRARHRRRLLCCWLPFYLGCSQLGVLLLLTRRATTRALRCPWKLCFQDWSVIRRCNFLRAKSYWRSCSFRETIFSQGMTTPAWNRPSKQERNEQSKINMRAMSCINLSHSFLYLKAYYCPP